MTPSVSVVIPTYNRAEMVSRAVASVQAQTWQDWECIVVDDGGADDTEDVLYWHGDSRIRYIRHERNKGANAARNTGIRAAQGQYIAFLDSDDRWDTRYLSQQMKTFSWSYQAAMVYSWARLYYDGYTYDKCGRYEGREFYRRELGGYYTPGTSQAVIRADVLRDIGGFDEAMPAHQERELFVRLAAAHFVTYTPEVLVHGYHLSGWAHVGTALARRKAGLLFYEKHKARLEVEGLLEDGLKTMARAQLFGLHDPEGARQFAAILRKEVPSSPWGYAVPALSYMPSPLRRIAPRAVRWMKSHVGNERPMLRRAAA